MAETLGEKLRHAREERGLTLSEVADQTRISSLYLESIENDDYRILPGGIFNKGFVKSYAKYVGINEQEALQEYANLVAESSGPAGEEIKTYRPEVLTDDRSGSMAPTVITALIILGLMTGGVLFLINYLRSPSETPATNTASIGNTNTAIQPPAETTTETTSSPQMGTAKIEFTALTQPVSLTATSDGKMSSNVVNAGSTIPFEPKESLKLSYSRSLAQFVQLTINGKKIMPPTAPLNPRRNAIEFEINKDNLERIWSTGSITGETVAASDTNTNTATPEQTPAATPPAAAATSPTPAAAVPVRTPVRPNPAVTQPTRPPATPVTRPTQRPATITVPSANRPG